MRCPRVPSSFPVKGIGGWVLYQQINRGVYVLQAEHTDKIKIGWSENICNRINQLQTGCPHRLLWLADSAGFGVEDDEREIHARLHSDRLSGEWFSLSAGVADWMMEEMAIRTLTPELSKVIPGAEHYEPAAALRLICLLNRRKTYVEC